jgi:dTDP-4-amino-4,6-dideoxygalactose transaminase
MEPRYIHHDIGINSRLDTIQAAILLEKLPRLDEYNANRRRLARRYDDLFHEFGLTSEIQLPAVAEPREHTWNQYTIRIRGGQRDALRIFLSAVGIGTEVYYPVPLHLQSCFSYLGYSEGSLPETEAAAKEVISLPIFPGLTEDEQQLVVERIRQFFHRSVS